MSATIAQTAPVILHRRSFLAATGAAALVDGTAGVLSAHAEDAIEAASSPSFLIAPDPVDESAISQTLEADVLVVGAGVAGMSAARAGAEAGATVVVVEKAAHPMCRGNFGCQIGAIDSFYQQKNNLTVNKRALVERYQRDTLQDSNQFFIQYWADHSGETVDWCLAVCPDVVELPLDARSELANLADGQVGIFGYAQEEGYDPEAERYPEFNTKLVIGSNNTELNKGGFSLMLEHFERIVEEAGSTFLFNTFGRYLEKDDYGRVIGLIAQAQDGTYLRINARATVLACGDFGNDLGRQ